MEPVKLIGALIALIIAAVFTFLLPSSGAEGIVITVASAVFSYLGWDWRTQYLEIQTWVKSKSLWGVVIVFIPVLGYVIGFVFSIDLAAVMIFGFTLQNIFQWLLVMGGGLFLIGSVHAKLKKAA